MSRRIYWQFTPRSQNQAEQSYHQATKDDRLGRLLSPVARGAGSRSATSRSTGSRVGMIGVIMSLTGRSRRPGNSSRGSSDGGIRGEGIVSRAGLVGRDLSAVDEDQVGALEQVAIPLSYGGEVSSSVASKTEEVLDVLTPLYCTWMVT